MNTAAARLDGWTTAYGARFGDTRCEIHMRLQSGVHVANVFDVDANAGGVLDSSVEICGTDAAHALHQADLYLTARYGSRNSSYLAGSSWPWPTTP